MDVSRPEGIHFGPSQGVDEVIRPDASGKASSASSEARSARKRTDRHEIARSIVLVSGVRIRGPGAAGRETLATIPKTQVARLVCPSCGGVLDDVDVAADLTPV